MARCLFRALRLSHVSHGGGSHSQGHGQDRQLKKQEKEWLDWFMDRFEAETRAGSKSLIEDRVPWSQIEEKGIELKVIKTNVPGWFDTLRNKWQRLIPKKWCQEAEASIRLGEQAARPGDPKPIPLPIKRYDRWGDHRRSW